MILKVQRIKSEIQKVRMVTEITIKSPKQNFSKSRIRPSKRRLLSPRYISLETQLPTKTCRRKRNAAELQKPSEQI